MLSHQQTAPIISWTKKQHFIWYQEIPPVPPWQKIYLDYRQQTTDGYFRAEEGNSFTRSSLPPMLGCVFVCLHLWHQFKLTKAHANADGLSRLPLPTSPRELNVISDASIFNMGQTNALLVTSTQVQHKTKVDPILSKYFNISSMGGLVRFKRNWSLTRIIVMSSPSRDTACYGVLE